MANNQTPEQIVEAAAAAASKKVDEAAAEVERAAEAARAEEQAALAAKGRVVKLVDISAVFGDVYHPFTQVKFETGAMTPHEIDDWVKAQIDGGKLKLA